MSGPWDDYKPGAKPSDDGPWADYAKGAPAPAAPAGKSGLIRRGIGDTALSFGQGAVGAVKSLTDLAGPDNAVSEKLGDINEGMAGMLSPERRAEAAARQAKIEEADKSGSTLDQVTSRLGGFVEAPLQSTAQGVGSIVPTLAAALATRGRSIGAQVGTQATIGAGMGVGGVKGQNYDAVMQEALNRGMSPDEAKALAVRASEFSLQNAPQQALAGGIGAVAGTTGAERIVSGMVKGGSLGKRVLKGALEEGVPEGIQGAQAQYAQNVALNDAGFQTDPSTGVLGQGMLEGAIGAVIGGGFGAPKQGGVTQPGATQPTQQPSTPTQDTTPQPTMAPSPQATTPDASVNPAPPPVTGPLTAAVAAMAPRSIDGAMPPLPVGATRELDGNDAARVQREADKPGQSVGLILPDDITRGGQPFTSMESAGRALAKAGPGFELARVKGGLVVRRIGAAAPAAAQPSASTLQSGPMARFAARFAQGDNTLARGALDGGVDVQELSIEDANAAAAPQASKKDDKDELIPTGRKRELNLEVVEPASPDGLQPTIDPPRREPRKAQPARDMTDDDVVKAYVEQRRAEGTLAGRRFAGDFDAGRITPEDVLGLVRPRRPTPTADERLQAAAAQRAQPEPATGLVDSDGRPIPTTLKERREQQRNVAGAAELADGASDGRRADAGRGGAAVGRVADVEGARQPGRAPGDDSGGIAASPVGDGLRADQALTPDATKQDAAAPAETAPPQGRVPDAAAPSYDRRNAGRLERIKAADSPEAAQAVLQEEYADDERHFEGTTRLERAARTIESDRQREQSSARAKEQADADYAAGKWVVDEALTQLFKRQGRESVQNNIKNAADFKAAMERAQAENPEREYAAGRVRGTSSDYDTDAVRYRKRQAAPVSTWTLDPAPAPADPDAQDSRSLRESDRRARAVASASEELASQIQGDIAESDFDAAEVLPGLALFAKQSGVPADELRQEVLARIRKSGLKPADIRRIERALDPTRKSTPAAPTNAKPPAPQTRPEQLIELRKRLSVLNQLLECLG